MDLIILTFGRTGIFPWDPDTVLRRLPTTYPAPKPDIKKQPSTLQDLATYSMMSPTYTQTEYVKEAREQAREATIEENAVQMQKVLSATADLFLESPNEVLEQAAELLRRIGQHSRTLLSSARVCA
jgi:hypothetical protein